MGDSLALYGWLVSGHVRSQLQYRTSFVASLVGTALISGIDFVAVLVLFANVPTLGGWSIAEVGLLYGISTVAFALTDLLVGHLDRLPELVRTGAFDLFLVRPRGTLFQVVSSDFALRRLGRAAQGLVVLGWALAHVDVAWTPTKIALVPFTVVSAMALFTAVWIVVICVVFWVVEGRETANAFTDGGTFLSQYPFDIFGDWLRRLFTFVVPMAFVAYLPASYLLDKPLPDGLPGWIAFASPVVACLAALLAGAVWRFAVGHYRSAGG